MAEQIDVVDDFELGDMKFEIAKGYIVTARNKGKIIAMRAATHYFHAENMARKLLKDANYRKQFIETYKLGKTKV